MDRHSFFVRVLQIALPLLAIGALFAVFFFDWSNDEAIKSQFEAEETQFGDLYAKVDDPRLDTTNAEGDELRLKANTLTQDESGESTLQAEDVEGDLLIGGSNWEVQSDRGETDTTGSLAEFSGRVMALIDGRYNLLGEQLIANINERVFTSQFPIDVKSDRFDVSADRAKLYGELGARVVELEGNVEGVVRLENFND